MDKQDISRRRTFAIISHPDAGKTTLTEKLLLFGGAIQMAGTVKGRKLSGTAETQLVMATVPGIDPGFAYVPRMVSTRITSTSIATVEPDGTVSIEIKSQPVPGAEYAPTRTTLHGSRVSAAGVGGATRRAAGQ